MLKMAYLSYPSCNECDNLITEVLRVKSRHDPGLYVLSGLSPPPCPAVMLSWCHCHSKTFMQKLLILVISRFSSLCALLSVLPTTR